MKRLWVMLGVGAAVAACGGGGSGGGVGSGGGGAGGGGGGGGGGGAAATQIAFVIPATSCPGLGGSFAGVQILISTNRAIADACTQATDVCVSYANVSGLAVLVANYDLTGGTAAPVAPGTYDLTLPTAQVGTVASAVIEQTDANCNSTLTGQANASGTITITAVSGTSVTGSYDVTAYGNHYAGSFDAGVCSSGVFQGDLCQSSGGTCTGTKQCL